MESRKARESFTTGLYSALKMSNSLVKGEVMLAIQDMNTLKKGVVDFSLDFDKVLAALDSITRLSNSGLNQVETCALFFNALNLLKCDEYAVRDYALHAVGKLIDLVPENSLQSSEKWLFT